MTLISLIGLSFCPLAVCVAWLALSGSRTLARSALAIGVGLVAVVVAVVAEAALAPPFARPFPGAPALDAFVRIAFVEEGAKLLAVAAVFRAEVPRALRRSAPRAALTVAIVVALSFASFESLHYGTRDSGSLAPRILFALPLHVAASMVASLSLVRGFAFGRYLLAAAFSHAVFNLALSSGYPASLVAYLLVPALALVAVNLWLKSGEGDRGKDGLA